MTHPAISQVLSDMQAIGFGQPEPIRWVVSVVVVNEVGSTVVRYQRSEPRSMDAVEAVLERLGIDLYEHGELFFSVRPA
jgi:hypothetical protein